MDPEKMNSADNLDDQQHPSDPDDNWENDPEEDEPEENPEDETGQEEDPDDGPEGQPDVSATRAFSERLSQARAKDHAEIMAGKQEIAQLKAMLAGKESAVSSAEQMLLGQYQGQANPYTGKLIRTIEDVREYQSAYQDDIMTKAGLTPDHINRIVDEKVSQKLAEQQARYDTERRADEALKRDVAEIGKLNPNIKSVEDLGKLPPDIKNGMDELYFGGQVRSLALAYRLAAGNTAKPAGKPGGKDHFVPTGGAAGNPDSRPDAETMEMYRRMNPGMSDKEYIAHWNESRKGG